MARDDPVSEDFLVSHSKVGGLMYDEAVNLYKAPWVNQSVDPFAGGHFAPRVLRFYFLGTASELRLFCLLLQRVESLHYCSFSTGRGLGSYKVRPYREGISSRRRVPSLTFCILRSSVSTSKAPPSSIPLVIP